MKTVKKKKILKVKLADRILKKLTGKKTFTYGQLAEYFGANARAIGQAVKKAAKTNKKITKLVIYSPNTRVRNYVK